MNRGIWQIPFLLLFCLFAYGVTAGGHFSSTDEEDIFLNTALLSDLLLSPAAAAQTAGGTSTARAPMEPGQSLVALPWFWLGRALTSFIHPRWHAYSTRLVMTTFNLLVTLCTVWVIHRWLLDYVSNKVALTVAGLYGLASMAWPYSQTFYREPLVGLCLLVAFWFGSRFRNTHHRPHLLISLAAMMLAIMTKTTAVIAAPWWLLLVLPEKQIGGIRSSKGLAAAGVLTAAVLLILPAKMPTLQAYVAEITLDVRHALPDMLYYGLHGLLTSPGKGLLVTVPPILLAIIGFPRFWRDHRREAAAIAGLCLSFILIYSSRRGWHGGASWGPRYLLPILPLMLLPSAAFIQLAGRSPVNSRSKQTAVRAAVVLLAIVGVGVQLSAVAIFPLNYYDLKIKDGTVQPDSLDGGRAYLRELYFEPAHSPVWGHAVLAVERLKQSVRYGNPDSGMPLPSSARQIWHYFIALDALDFWWLHWSLIPDGVLLSEDQLGYELVAKGEGYMD